MDGRYKAIFNSSMDSFVIFDINGNILDFNEQTERMFERPYSKLIELSAKEIVHPDYYSGFKRFLKEVYLKGYGQCEVMNVRGDGSTFLCDLRGTRFEHDGQVNLFGTFREITEYRQTERWNRYLMTHDPLTGLYNRAYFEEEMFKLERGRVFPVSIVMIDVDGLKSINDRQGHRVGDELLRRAAQAIRMAFRSEDVIARIGGDEFALLLPGSGSERAREAMLRLHNGVSDHNRRDPGPRLSLSLGAATAYQGSSLNRILEEADKSMYEEKLSKMKTPRKSDPTLDGVQTSVSGLTEEQKSSANCE